MNSNFFRFVIPVAVCLGFFALLPFLRMIPAAAQPVASFDSNRDTDFDARIRPFFESLIKGNTLSALEEFLRQSSLGTSSANTQLAALKEQIEETKTQFGNIAAFEKLDSKHIGEDIAVVRYILKHEQYPVIWIFKFYRRPTQSAGTLSASPWTVIEVYFDTDISPLN